MAYKHFKPGDIVSATLEKLDLENDDAGLRMQVRHGRVFITAVEGLFRERFESRGLPVLPGDQVLEFCGKEYMEYKNLREILRMQDESAKIWLKVKRIDPDEPSWSTDSEWSIQSDSEPEEEEEQEELLALENGPVIEPGDVCEVQGLVNKPELNGETVEVVREVKGKKGRWQVRVQETQKLVAIPEENLIKMEIEEEEEEEAPAIQPGDIMVLTDLKNKPELNGEKVEVVRPVKGKAGKWQVKVYETGKVMAVSEDNLIPVEEEEEEPLLLQNAPAIAPGSTMVLQNMDKKPELNDETVEVLREVKGKPGKWQVRVHSTSKIVVISEANLYPTEAAEVESEEESEAESEAESEPESEAESEEESKEESAKEETAIEAGALMELHQMDKKPELNGELVEVLREVKGKSGKWQVKVRETGKVVVVSSHQLTEY